MRKRNIFPDGVAVFRSIRKWEMAVDGKTLTIVVDVKGPDENSNYNYKRTFLKK